MHRYRIAAQSLIVSILNLVLAAPIVVQEIHEVRGDDMPVVTAEDVPAMPEKSDELDAASDRPTSPPPSLDAMAPPQHSSLSDGSTSSGYPTPHLSSVASVSGYSWLLDRPPRLSPNLPAPLHESAFPHPSSPESSEIPLPAWYLEWSREIPPSPHHPPEWLQGLEPQIQSPPAWWLLPPSPHPSSAVSSEIPPPAPEVPPSPQLTGSDWATTDTYSLQDEFTPSYHLSSSADWNSDQSMSPPYSLASDGSLSSQYFSASDGSVLSHDSISMPSQHSMPEGLATSLTPDGSPLSLSSPPTETPPVMKKLKILAGVIIIGGAIAGIVGS